MSDLSIRCPNGKEHLARVMVTTVLVDGTQVPRRAICATCRHDWDPSEDPLFEPCDFCLAGSGEPCEDGCECRACQEAAPDNDQEVAA